LGDTVTKTVTDARLPVKGGWHPAAAVYCCRSGTARRYDCLGFWLDKWCTFRHSIQRLAELRPHSTTRTRAIPREDPRDEIARVGRKDVGVSGESVSVSVSMSVSWNVALTSLHLTMAVLSSFGEYCNAVLLFLKLQFVHIPRYMIAFQRQNARPAACRIQVHLCHSAVLLCSNSVNSHWLE